MHRKSLVHYTFLILLILSFGLSGCSGGGSKPSQTGSSHTEAGQSIFSDSGNSDSKGSDSDNHTDSTRQTRHEFLVPEASGVTTYTSGAASLDASNISEGYVMGAYTGGADKAKIQITLPDGTVCTYTLPAEGFATFPLSGGDGHYQIDILEHAYENKYAILLSQPLEVTLNDEFKPFLYPNQHVWFTPDDDAVQFGVELSDQSSNDLDYVEQVYNYMIENISYDTEAAENVSADYLPDIDRTMETKKGICFDYASLMCSLLRSQGIPTKLVFGYSGTAYHAWISVYTEETGWVDNIIEFDGKNWSLVDPTLAANNKRSSVQKYIGDASNYTVKYYF